MGVGGIKETHRRTGQEGDGAFYENSVHDAGTLRLAEALEVARALAHVDIRYNNIGILGVERLHRAKARNAKVSHQCHIELAGQLKCSCI